MPENSSCSSAGSCTKSSCEGCPSHNGGPQSFLIEQNKFSNIKHVIGVVSGKGGVGKSFVTSSLAVNMAKKGYKVGILDADITGPSIPKMFGAHDQILGDENGLMHPYETKEGIKLISVNLLMDNEEDPVIWRGPVIAGVVKQFWNETVWGDIDYIFVDMPPGTGDVPLTVFQSLPVDGIIIVTSPQELVSMIVAKAVKMARMMNIPILGLIENYAYFHCPDNDKDYEIFGPSHLAETADAYGLKVLARLPINPSLAAACDAGKLADCHVAELDDCCDFLADNFQ